MKHKQVSGMFETSLCHFDIYFFMCITLQSLQGTVVKHKLMEE